MILGIRKHWLLLAKAFRVGQGSEGVEGRLFKLSTAEFERLRMGNASVSGNSEQKYQLTISTTDLKASGFPKTISHTCLALTLASLYNFKRLTAATKHITQTEWKHLFAVPTECSY